MILVSGPALAKLRLRTRKWAHQAISRGRFGPVTRRKGILYVPLKAIESDCGEKFTADQIHAAAEGRPDRFLTITEPMEAT
jgi:hypothetical protein